jgi:VanZ family protein
VIDLYRHRHLLLTAYIVVLLGATLAPLPGSSYGPSGFDKLVHVGLFGGLAFLVYYYESEPTLRGAVRSFVLASGAAMMIEVLQAVLPFRNADLKDFIAGLLGAAFGVAGAAVLRGALSRWGRSADSTKV